MAMLNHQRVHDQKIEIFSLKQLEHLAQLGILKKITTKQNDLLSWGVAILKLGDYLVAI